MWASITLNLFFLILIGLLTTVCETLGLKKPSFRCRKYLQRRASSLPRMFIRDVDCKWGLVCVPQIMKELLGQSRKD